MILTINVFSQNYYYYKNTAISISKNKQIVNVYTSSSYNLDLDTNKFIISSIYSNSETDKILQIKIKNLFQSEDEYNGLLSNLYSNSNIKNICYFYNRGTASPIGTSKFFYVKVKNENSYLKLKEFENIYNFDIVKQVPFMSNWYILSLKSNNSSNVISISNSLYESGYFECVDPAFMFNFNSACTNDPSFSNLWGLQNPNGIDIKTCSAWNIALGQNIVVAVVDHGIEKTHEDLNTNINSLSFNALTGTSPSSNVGDHGTHIAGTIAGIRNNNKGIVGVAPNSTLMSISHPIILSTTLSAELASGISWAWQNGAHIINNSWGDQGGEFYAELHSLLLEQSILDAINLGRNGLGSIVVFASGNFSSEIDYPANFNSNILCVGSINSNGSRSSFSGYGNLLDVVGPGENILSTWTGNSYNSISGTSMAAPHVSGLSALILSVNSVLTGVQVRNIIESTAQKTGTYNYSNNNSRPNGTWNNQMGYGLVNAFDAVKMACQSITTVNNQIITTNANYTDCKIQSTNTTINAAKTTFNAYKEAVLIDEFEVKNGAEFEIITY